MLQSTKTNKAARKQFFSLFLVLSLLLSGITTAKALQTESNQSDNAMNVIVDDEDNSYVMTGAHNSILLIKSISSEEYMEMMDILYPNGVVDEQGQEMAGVENMQEMRDQYIANHMKAYSMNGQVQSEVELTPFTISIEDQSNGEYNAMFYRANVGQDVFVFPSEWGNQSFGFAYLSEKNVYLAFTDMGIWSIDSDRMSAQKITTDTYMGKTQAIISAEFQTHTPNGYLLWIDSVAISPDGGYAIYRTNRDATAIDETSLWKINLSTGTEEQFVPPEENNDIVGFITDNDAVVGALNDTRMIDVADNKVVTLEVPTLSNSCVKDVKDGKVVISNYDDGSTITTVSINDVDKVTGAMSEITSVSGYLDGEPEFSPSGNKIAVGYGTDAEVGVNNVMIVDVPTSETALLTDSMATTRSASTINSNIARYLWVDDDTVLVDTQQENELPAIVSTPVAAAAAQWDIVFGNTPPSIVNFNSPLSTNQYSGFVSVNSKWNQPRKTGSNPHNGVDLNAALNTPVYAPYAGWTTGINVVGNADIQLLVDANNNRVKDDGDYYVRFYHMNSREANGYKTKGELIGHSGNQGGVPAHLHFGICSLSGGLKWLRNEVNYRYLSSTNWQSGQDLDIYSQVRWNDNRPSIIAYVKDETGKSALSEVRMFYRTTTSGTWTDGGVMTKSGDTYSYNFNGKFSSGTTVYWMVRLTRSGVSQVAFCPAKYYKPVSNPNAASQPYGFWTNTMS